MPFRKGKSGNPSGRPKGANNKATADFKSFITTLLEENLDTIRKDLKAIEPKERLAFFEKLFKYVVAQQRSSTLNINQLSEDQVNELYQTLIDNIYETE